MHGIKEKIRVMASFFSLSQFDGSWQTPKNKVKNGFPTHYWQDKQTG